MLPEDYLLGAKISRDGTSELWRGRRRSDDAQVLVKLPASAIPERLTVARYHHEFEILRTLECKSVPRVLGLERDGDRPLLVFADDGVQTTLEELLALKGPLALPRFFELAKSLAQAVGDLHQVGVIHRALQPDHVLVPPVGNRIQLVGFGRATRIQEEQSTGESNDLRTETQTLPYMAPEQTGRMNRQLDYRADLYSLGVLLYQMLAGELPLMAADVVGWIHAHIAIAPTPITDYRRDVPAALQTIVARLLEKEADRRYQNAFGLLADLQEVESLAVNGETSFVPRKRDRSGRFLLSQKLYGRETEAEQLLEVFSRVAEGERHLVVIAGYSGIGKTALVYETHPALVRQGGHFSTGKVDQYQRTTPYAALREAFRDLIYQLVDEPEQRRQEWTNSLNERLHAEMAVIAEVLPELKLLVGPQPAAPKLAAADADDRFRLAFREFVGVFCDAAHPLVLFLDDLQWVDHASLTLLQDLAVAEELGYLLVIGAYRSNEVEPGHPLAVAIDRLTREDASVTRIDLLPLSEQHIATLIGDSFEIDSDTASDLARTVFDTTAGNPFFARQVLRTQFLEGALRFDFRDSRWRWDRERSPIDPTENVVDLMVARLSRLSEATCDSLRFASCLGSAFNLKALSLLRAKPAHETLLELRPAIEKRLLLPLHGREWMEVGDKSAALVDEHAPGILFRFRHDRVQQAAYRLVPEEDLADLHLAIARSSRDSTDPDQLFEIVGHYNRAAERIADPAERLLVARLNLDAAKKAAGAIACEAAVEFCKASLSLLGPAPFRDHYREAFTAQLRTAECLARLGEFERAEEVCQETIGHCRNSLDRVDIHTQRMEMHIAQGLLVPARQALVEMLSIFGVELDETNVADVARDAAVAVAKARGGRTIEQIVSAPELTDPDKIALLGVLGRSVDTAFMSGREWVVAVTSIAARTALEHGMTVSASMTLSTYGLVDAESNDAAGFARRSEYGRIGSMVAERFGDRDWISRSNVSNPHHYDTRFRDVIGRFDRAADAGWVSGALTWGAYGEVRCLFMMLSAGLSLERLSAERAERQARVDRAQRQVSSVCCEALARTISSLRGAHADPSLLGSNREDEADLEQRANQLGPWAACKYYSLKQLVAALFGDYQAALTAMREVDNVGHALLGMSHEHLHYLFGAITAAELHRQSEAPDRARLRERQEEAVRYFRGHSEGNVDFVPGHHISEAASCEVDDEPHRALEHYNRAIAAATDSEQRHLGALANERAAAVADQLGLAALAKGYATEARRLYAEWGAAAKVRDIERRFESVLSTEADTRATRRSSLPAQLSVADGESLLKACRAISGELRLDALLRQQMRILVENAGAQRGLVVLHRDGVLNVEAEAVVEAGEIATALPSAPLVTTEPARAAIEHVFRTGEHLHIDDVANNARFGRGEVTNGHAPRSVVCLPIDSKGTRLGVIYLENRIATHAFRDRPQSALTFLISQVAASLENAFLYRDLELEVDERVRAEAVLREERDYSTRIIQSSPMVVCGVDPKGVVVFVNPAGERITGYRADELTGRSFEDVFISESDSGHGVTLTDMLSTDVDLRDRAVGLIDRSGDEHIVSWSCVRHVNDRRELLQLVCFGNDITQSVALEGQLRRAQKLETIGTLASGISHDFNNILLPILGFSDLLADDLHGNDAALESVAEIRSAALRAADLVRQILVAGRKTAPTHRPVQVTEVAREVTRLTRATLPAAIEVVCEADEGCPAILADATQVHQVLLNLTTNAGQAMAAAGGRIEIRVRRSTVDAHTVTRHPRLTSGPSVTVTVRDTGPGMDASTLSRIFDPFFTTKDPHSGTGLGLWVVYGIMDAPGRAIEVASEPGVGTTFTLHFCVEDQPVRAPDQRENGQVRGDETVLLVDDEAAIVRIVERALSSYGYQVTSFTDSDRALAAFRAHPSDFDAIVTDLSMPKIDGQNLAREVSAIRSDIPVILVSGIGMTLDAEALRKIGIREVIQKPALPKEYAAAIRRNLDHDG